MAGANGALTLAFLPPTTVVALVGAAASHPIGIAYGFAVATIFGAWIGFNSNQGPCANARGSSWTYALSMRFATVEDHDAYQADADHHAFIDTFKDWWARVLMMDLA